jgi:hypothetical protein
MLDIGKTCQFEAFVESKGFENHQPQYDRWDNVADHDQAGHTALSEQRGDLFWTGGRFGRELFTTFHVWQPDQTPQLFVVGLIEYTHIDKNKQHQHDRGLNVAFIPDMDQERQNETCQPHHQE